MYSQKQQEQKQRKKKLQRSYVDVLISTTTVDMIEPNRATEDKMATK